MREHCVVHILGTEGHFVFRVTLAASSRDRESEVDTDRQSEITERGEP